MNLCVFTGRFTANPELKTTKNGTPLCKFTLAVSAKFAAKGEEKKTNFIQFTAWQHTAEFIVKYFSKGSEILIEEAECVTGSFADKDGTKHYTVDFTAKQVGFMGKLSSASSPAARGEGVSPNGLENLDGFVEVLGDINVPF